MIAPCPRAPAGGVSRFRTAAYTTMPRVRWRADARARGSRDRSRGADQRTDGAGDHSLFVWIRDAAAAWSGARLRRPFGWGRAGDAHHSTPPLRARDHRDDRNPARVARRGGGGGRARVLPRSVFQTDGGAGGGVVGASVAAVVLRRARADDALALVLSPH